MECGIVIAASEAASGYGFVGRQRLSCGFVVCAGLATRDARDVLRQRAFNMKRAGENLDFDVAQARRAALAADLGAEMPAKVTPSAGDAQGLAGPAPLLEDREDFWRTPAQFKKRSILEAEVPGAPAGLGAFARGEGFVQHGGGIQVHATTDDSGQFVAVAEKTKACSCRGVHFDQHVYIAMMQIEIVAQHGTKQAEFAYATGMTKIRNSLEVQINRECGHFHATRLADLVWEASRTRLTDGRRQGAGRSETR